ncbi:MAG: LPXTG cell wall anchor domain-containing protein [Bacteroidetes bacterium]|nr:LPXTG cell wall anchor domain-containing protein [Bacteroidota bacterium]
MTKHRLFTIISFLLFAVGELTAQGAPAASDSPYSDQRYITPDDPAWYETPVLWIGLALLVIALVVLYMRRKKERYT